MISDDPVHNQVVKIVPSCTLHGAIAELTSIRSAKCKIHMLCNCVMVIEANDVYGRHAGVTWCPMHLLAVQTSCIETSSMQSRPEASISDRVIGLTHYQLPIMRGQDTKHSPYWQQHS